jgi:molecular chaperone GrpE
MTEKHEPRLRHDRTPDQAPSETGGPLSIEEAVRAVTSPEQQADSLAFQKAEFEKYRKRERRDMEEHELKAREEIVGDFLEVADNLERAITSWKEGDKKDVQSVLTGVDLVLRLFRSKLERWAVTVLDSKGKPFDPYVHHAVSQVPSANVTPGTVLHEVQKGYWMGERLLRPASVVVASAPETSPDKGASDEAQGTGGEAGGDWHGYQRTRP